MPRNTLTQPAAAAAETPIAVALQHHWQTSAVHPRTGLRVLVCGRCSYSDGVSFVWPCPTVAALTGVEPGNWQSPTPLETQ